jgi:pentatricopeptide repeat protein
VFRRAKEIFLDRERLRCYRCADQDDQGGWREKSLEHMPDGNISYKSSTEEEERVSSPPSQTGKQRRIFFETKSLAEVYAKQGHITMALEIYRRMQIRNPADQEIEKRISELEARRFPVRATKTEENKH